MAIVSQTNKEFVIKSVIFGIDAMSVLDILVIPVFPFFIYIYKANNISFRPLDLDSLPKKFLSGSMDTRELVTPRANLSVLVN